MVVALFVVWALVALYTVAVWPVLGETTARARWLALGALAGVLALAVLHQLFFATLAEDAFISFRYSLNLAEGNGLVFNVGERVEGYSNFLWVVLLAAPRALFGADIVLCARILGIACTLGCVLVAFLLGNRLAPGYRGGVLAAVLTAAAGSLAAYGPSGLETPLFALLVLLAVLAAVSGRPALAGLAAVASVLTRPDGALLVLLLGGWLLLGVLRRRDGHTWRGLACYAAAVLAVGVPWTVWRLAYYGHLLPNAVAAKSGAEFGWQFSVGLAYLGGFALAALALLVAVALSALAVVSRRRAFDAAARSALVLLGILALVQIVFFVCTGGDWMPAWRFFAPAMPLLAVGVGVIGVRAVPGRVAGLAVPVLGAAVAVLLLVQSVVNPEMKQTIDVWRTQVHELASMGAWVHRSVPPGTVISTFANGALSYEAGPRVTVVDQLGLTDEYIARHGKRKHRGVVGHLAYDYDYLLDVRRPAIVFISGSGLYPRQSCRVLGVFRARYVAASFRDSATGRWALAYLRRDRAPELARLLGADREYRQAPCPSRGVRRAIAPTRQ